MLFLNFSPYYHFFISVDSSRRSVILTRASFVSHLHANTVLSLSSVRATCGCIWTRIQPAGHTSSSVAAATTTSLIRHNWQNISTDLPLFSVHLVLLVLFCHWILLARLWPRPPFLAPLLLTPVAITLPLLCIHRHLSVCLLLLVPLSRLCLPFCLLLPLRLSRLPVVPSWTSTPLFARLWVLLVSCLYLLLLFLLCLALRTC